MFQILALYLDFDGAENINFPLVQIQSFGGCWRFLIGVFHLDLELDMIAGLWYSHVFRFCSLDFDGAKNIIFLSDLIWNLGVAKPIDHIQIKIKMPNPTQEPPASSKVPNEDLSDIDVLFNFKIKIEGQNSDHGYIKDH